MWVLALLLFVSLFEWANEESYYKDRVDIGNTLIKLRTDISDKQKAIYLKENEQLGAEIKNDILVIKYLIIFFSAGLFIDSYLLIKKKKSSFLSEKV